MNTVRVERRGKDSSMKSIIPGQKRQKNNSILGSEKGMVLLLVVVLSAIVLAIMTTMLYITTIGTQTTGLQKRYRTAREAAFGGVEIVKQIINTQSDSLLLSKLTTSLNLVPYSMNVSYTTLSTCQNIVGSGTVYYGLSAKIMTGKDNWNDDCKENEITINGVDPQTYDIRFDIGSGAKYTIYAKIVHTVQGNTSEGYGGSGLSTLGGVVSSSGELETVKASSLYTIEMDAEKAANRDERAKLSLIYQY